MDAPRHKIVKQLKKLKQRSERFTAKMNAKEEKLKNEKLQENLKNEVYEAFKEKVMETSKEELSDPEWQKKTLSQEEACQVANRLR